MAYMAYAPLYTDCSLPLPVVHPAGFLAARLDSEAWLSADKILPIQFQASAFTHTSHPAVDSPETFIEPGLSTTSGRNRVSSGVISYTTSEVASSPNSSKKLEYIKIESDNFQQENESYVGDRDQNHDHERCSYETNHDTLEDTPAWVEMKTKAGKDRKRLPLACIACRRKKIRCSGESPACKHCVKSRIPCVYKATTRKAAPRTDYMAMLDRRLKRMEERVIRIIPKDEADRIPAVARAIVKPNATILPARVVGKKRPADEAFGAELENWIGSIDTSSQKLETRPFQAMAKQDDQEESRLLNEGVDYLPSMEIQEHLAEVYFDYVYGQSYHLLHKPSFMRRLEAGRIPPVLMLAVCAVSARFSTHPQLKTEPAFLRGDNWARPAREIALRRFDSPNITILIVFLLLGLHEFGTCQGGRSWMLGGMAHRMAYALQLHKDLDHDPLGNQSANKSELSFTDREIRRRTMWACFMMDRFNSSGTERPMFASEQYIKIQLPVKEQLFQMEIPGPTENLEGTTARSASPGVGQMSDAKKNMGVAAYTVRIVALWGRIVQYFNLGGIERDQFPIWSSESEWYKIKCQVDDFRKGLPESLHYNATNLQNHDTENIANQFIYLHIAYSQVSIFLHRFAFPATSIRKTPKETPSQFLQDGREAALEAATNISDLLDEAINHRVFVPFAGYCAYLSSAVHIHAIFSKNSNLEASAKHNLARNVRYLTRMKKYWGMFHFMSESLKELYRQHADAVSQAPGSRCKTKRVYQYGDWYDRYPHGVSRTDYEEPVTGVKTEPGIDAVLGHKSDLQSVEEFFATLSPSFVAVKPRRKTTTTPRSQHPLSYKFNAPHSDPGLQCSRSGLDSMDVPFTPFGFPEFYDRSHVQPSRSSRSHVQTAPIISEQIHDLPSHSPSKSLIIEPQNQYPGMMSQLDHQLVLACYNNVDSSSVTRNLSNLWDMDFSGGGGDVAIEPSGAWFMPFNLNPPDFGVGGDVQSMFANMGVAGQDMWFSNLSDGDCADLMVDG